MITYFFLFKESLPDRFTGHLVEAGGAHRDWDPTGYKKKLGVGGFNFHVGE